MRAALGLALVVGGFVLARTVLNGNVPFAPLSAATGGISHVVDQGVGTGVGTGGGPSGPSMTTANTGGLP